MGNNFPCGVRNCCSLLLTLRCSQLLLSATDLAVFAHCYLPHRLSHHTLLKLLALQRSFYLLELLALQRSFFQLSHQLLLVLPTFASTATSLSTFASTATSLSTFASTATSLLTFASTATSLSTFASSLATCLSTFAPSLVTSFLSIHSLFSY